MTTGHRTEITAHEALRPGFGTSRTWQRTIGGIRYSFNAVLMPSGERRYFAHKLTGPDGRFACNWHPAGEWTIPPCGCWNSAHLGHCIHTA